METLKKHGENKRELQHKITRNLILLFAAISAITALVFIGLTALDFFDPNQMSLSLQMMNLSERGIIILDTLEISIYTWLIIIVAKSIIEKNKKSLVRRSIFIWLL